MNRQSGELERLTRFSSGASGAEGDFATLPPDAEILARIIGVYYANSLSLPAYAWEVVRDQELDALGLPPLMVADTYFAGGFGNFPAYELSGNRRVPVDGSAIVLLRQSIGGRYFTFSYTEQPIIGILGDSDGAKYAWAEVQPIPGGNFSLVPDGWSGTETVNPAIEVNGWAGIKPGTVVFLSRGYCAGMVQVKVEAVVGSSPQQQSIKIFNAGGGTFTLTFINGDAQTTEPIPYDINATDLQTALEALTNCPGPVVTGAGTASDPFIVGFASNLTFPLLVVDDSLLDDTQEWLFEFNNCCNDGAWYCMEPPGSTTTTQPPGTTTTGPPSTTTTAEQDYWYCMGPPVTTTTTTPGSPPCCSAGTTTSVRFTLAGLSGTWDSLDLSLLNRAWVLRPGAWNHPAPGTGCKFSGGAIMKPLQGGLGEIYFDYIPWNGGTYTIAGQSFHLSSGYILRFTTWDNTFGNVFSALAIYFCPAAEVNCCGVTTLSKVWSADVIHGCPNTITVTAQCTACACTIPDGILSVVVTGTGTYDGTYSPWWSGGVATVFLTQDFLTLYCTFSCDGGNYILSILRWVQSGGIYIHEETVVTGTPNCSGKQVTFNNMFTQGDQMVVSWS